ncbi:alpha/beta hydrolase [Bacteroidota bacterium]
MKIHIRVLLTTFLILLVISSYLKGQDIKINYKTIEDIPYRTGDNLTDYMKERCVLDLYFPENKTDFPAVVWFHGGGLRSGNKHIPERLTQNEIAVVAVNYRLHPQVQAPAYIEDASAAVAWVFKNIEKYGGNPEKIIVSGHSAGGYLTSMVGLDKRWLAEFDIDANRIACLVLFSGHTITHMTVRRERNIPDIQPVVDEFGPLYHVRPDAPPLVLITGDRNLELLGRYEENAYMARMMKVAGHNQTYLYELDGHNHGEMAGPAFTILLKHIDMLYDK